MQESSTEIIKELLVKQTSSTVRWVDCIEYCKNNGVDSYLELGPKRTLAGLIKQIDSTAVTESIGTLEEVKRFIKEFK